MFYSTENKTLNFFVFRWKKKKSTRTPKKLDPDSTTTPKRRSRRRKETRVFETGDTGLDREVDLG